MSASDIEDRVASFSNVGKCVDLFAPGVNINSSWKNSLTDTAVKSGTSMACPFVSGIIVRKLCKKLFKMYSVGLNFVKVKKNYNLETQC